MYEESLASCEADIERARQMPWLVGVGGGLVGTVLMTVLAVWQKWSLKEVMTVAFVFFGIHGGITLVALLIFRRVLRLLEIERRCLLLLLNKK